MERIVGIDIGTSSCSVACVIDGQPQVLPVFDGRDEMPTYVAFTADGQKLVGWPAKRQAVMNPANTIFTIKRLIGRKFATEATQAELGLLPYQVTPSGSGGLWVQAGGRSYTPTEITAMMLGEVRRATEVYLGHPISQAVITVPAYFDESQIRATKAAAQIAGIEVVRHIAEPTAAAVAYGYEAGQNKHGLIAVYDLGGGTFDISILEFGDGKGEGIFEVKAVNGDNRLGGEDFDHLLVRHFVEQIKREKGLDLSHDPLALHRIKDAAEQIKIKLDVAQHAVVDLPYLSVKDGQFFHAELKLTRDSLDRLAVDLINRTLEPCRMALRDAGVDPKELDALVLVGGMSRMPTVQKRVGELFGRSPEKHHDPSRIVALGAAIQAGVYSGEIKDVCLLDVVPLSLGVADHKGSFIRIIERNTTIPTKKSQKMRMGHFSSESDTEFILPEGPIRVYQGDDELVGNNLLLAELRLDFDPPTPGQAIEIEVTFDIDANGVLHVEVKDQRTGKICRQEIRVASDRLAQGGEAPNQQTSPVNEKRLAAVRAQADELLNTVDAALQAHRQWIDATILSKIEVAREGLQQAMESRDADELEGALAAFAAANNIPPPAKRPMPIPRPVEVKATALGRAVFISYSRADRAWLERLRIHLAPLERDGKIEIWHDGKIETGVPWQLEIAKAIENSVVAVLLVSANFMASQFIYENELPPILERQSATGLHVYPIFVSHVFYQRDENLLRLNAFNDPKRPLSALTDTDVDSELARLTSMIWERLGLSK